MITATQSQLIATFTEWERRYRENPAAFTAAVERAANGMDANTYGEAAAPYFCEILTEVKARSDK